MDIEHENINSTGSLASLSQKPPGKGMKHREIPIKRPCPNKHSNSNFFYPKVWAEYRCLNNPKNG